MIDLIKVSSFLPQASSYRSLRLVSLLSSPFSSPYSSSTLPTPHRPSSQCAHRLNRSCKA